MSAARTNGIVVMKFGGTSVAGTEELKRAARRIVAAREQGQQVVAVLSARGKTTDRLLEAAREISPRPDPREMDMLLSIGERESCALCAMAINDLGHRAISLTGSQAGIVTDSSHTNARIIDVRADRIRSALEEDSIVLVAGFQGVSTESRDVTTLGRGGSDTTAVALAAALEGEVCEIYTDVDGVFTADPRIVPDARKLPVVSYEEMLEMASSGARVLQLRAVEYGRNHGVRIHCRSSASEAPGTLVVSEQETMEQPSVTAVTHSTGEARVTLTGVPDEPGVAGRIFGALADANINVDMIIQNEPVSHDGGADLSFTVETEDLEKAVEVIRIEDSEIGIEQGDGQGLDRRRRDAQPPGRRRQGVSGPRREPDQHRDDLHLSDQDLVRDSRRPGPPGGQGSPLLLRAGRGRDPGGGPDRRAASPDRFGLTRPLRTL
jgi:aspartate kinase